MITNKRFFPQFTIKMLDDLTWGGYLCNVFLVHQLILSAHNVLHSTQCPHCDVSRPRRDLFELNRPERSRVYAL